MKNSLVGLFSGYLAAACGVALAQSPAPCLLPFQGRLTDPNGNAVTNGVRLVQFKIYDAPSAGATVWTGEIHRTTVNGGLVNVLLGTKTPFALTNSAGGQFFDQQLYLEITVDVSGPSGQPDGAITAADPPMLPRQVLLPVVFAKESADSRKLAGRDWTPIFGTNSPDGAIPGTKLAAESIAASQIVPRSMTSNQMADLQVDSRILADAAVTAQKIAPENIDLAHLSAALLRHLNPPGTIAAFAGATNKIPFGWMLCNGGRVRTNDYPDLFSAIGTNWGGGSPGSFCLPDLRGYFLRGVDLGRGQDLDRASRTNQAPGGNVGDAVGSIQDDILGKHVHKQGGNVGHSDLANFGAWFTNTASNVRPQYDYAVGYFPLTEFTGGPETRPKNAYVNYLIKY